MISRKPKKPKSKKDPQFHICLFQLHSAGSSVWEKISFLQAKVAAQQSSLVLLDVGRIQGIYIQGP